MTTTFRLGRALFATAIGGLGIQCLVRSNAVPALEPVHTAATLPLIGVVTGAMLIVAAIAMLLRPSAQYGAAALAVILLFWVVLLHVPAVAAAPSKGGTWTGAFETLALSGAALLLFGLTAREWGEDRTTLPLASLARVAGRIMYGASMPAFGVLHFLYIAYIVYVTPSWIPAHVFFAYATGLAHIASGVSLLTGVLARLAAYLTAAMFGSWVLIVHAPRVVRNPSTPSEWTSMLIALGMCGGALLIASALSNISRAKTHAADMSTLTPRATITT